jgi:hypothetical protein
MRFFEQKTSFFDRKCAFFRPKMHIFSQPVGSARGTPKTTWFSRVFGPDPHESEWAKKGDFGSKISDF